VLNKYATSIMFDKQDYKRTRWLVVTKDSEEVLKLIRRVCLHAVSLIEKLLKKGGKNDIA